MTDNDFIEKLLEELDDEIEQLQVRVDNFKEYDFNFDTNPCNHDRRDVYLEGQAKGYEAGKLVGFKYLYHKLAVQYGL